MRTFLALVLIALQLPAFAQNLAQNALVRARVLQEAKELPIFFTTTEEGMAPLPATIESHFINFVHPLSEKTPIKAGLRFLPVSRKNVQRTLKPILEDGDIVLSFRMEWANGGAYPSIQMGISHAGVIYRDGESVANVDAPLNEEYVGNLNSKHYKETPLLHIIRPRNLTESQKKNLRQWATLYAKKRESIYPAKISFNSDYSAPRFDGSAQEPLEFVKDIAKHALNIPAKSQTVFCSEFAWVLLALKDCNPVDDKASFAETGMPSCVSPLFMPMPAIGNFVDTQAPTDGAGLTDGPLLMLQKLELEPNDYVSAVKSVFTALANSRMSSGHRAVAQEFAQLFAPLENYYLGIKALDPGVMGIKQIFNEQMKRNYSPTAYMINTLLPENNDNRVLDYVGTIVFVD